jgi:hypothetical protein
MHQEHQQQTSRAQEYRSSGTELGRIGALDQDPDLAALVHIQIVAANCR